MSFADNKPARWLWWIGVGAGALACGLILFWGIRTANPLFAYDDAYISYRYARNLRDGVGLVYNAGDWVLGSTAPLYTLALAFLGLLVGNIEALAHWVSVVSWMAASVAALVLLWREGSPRGGMIAAVLLALQHHFVGAQGMETLTVVAAMMATAWAFLGGHKRLAVGLGAVLLLLRYDTALWLLFLGLEVWRRERRLPWRVAVGILAIVLPWFIFTFLRYGALMPTSAMAKIGQNADMQVREVAQSFIGILILQLTSGGSRIIALAWLLPLGCGLWAVLKRRRGLAWIVIWAAAYLLIYSRLNVYPFPWYMSPPLTALVLVCALGIGQLLGDGAITASEAHGGGVRPAPSRPRAKVAQVALGVVGTLLGLALAFFSWQRASISTEAHGHDRWSEYYQVAQWLRENSPQDATVAAIEIGIIGYYSNRTIIDTMGLVSADITRHLTGWTDTLVYAVTTHWPDYVVVLPGTAWDGISNQWWFTKHYAPVVSFDPTAENRGPSVVYAAVGAPAAGYSATAQAEYATGLVLESADVERQQLQPGESLDLWLQFRVARQVPTDYQLTVSLVDNQSGEQWAITSVWPYDAMSAYPTSHWQSGDIRRVPVRLAVPQELTAGAYRIGVLIYDPQQGRAVSLTADPSAGYPQVLLGYLRVGDPPEVTAASDLRATPADAEWGIGVRLNTISLPGGALAPGDVLPVQIEWQATQGLEQPATVFLHLVDAQERIVTQLDRPPFNGRFPLPVWRAGEVLRDEYLISLPPDLAPGSYSLRVGLYTPDGRLGISSRGGGPVAEDFVATPVQIAGK